MTDALSSGFEQRVLVLAPTRKDAALTRSILDRAGVHCTCCSTFEELCGQLDEGAAVIVLTEEAVTPAGGERLAAWLTRQPPWSDLPVLVLARQGADSTAVAQAMDQLGNVTVLERPMRVAALVSAVRTGLRARQRQYQIREQIAERERAEDALKQADRRKDEFLAILAHELRNPLAPIRNALHILRRTGLNDPAAARFGDMIERQVNHMVRLVDDLLEVSRITRGKIDLRKEPIDLYGVIRSVADASRPLVEAAGQELTVSLPQAPLILDADAVRLSQIFANLLNNAMKYTESGGRIWITASSEGRSVTVSVRDTGVGLRAEMLTRVFDLFTQADREASIAQGGLGIGLTLVKTLVEMHGGTVEARSEGLRRGSEFIVRLPLTRAVRGADRPSAAGPPVVLVAHRILVVDDNRDSADSLGALLRLLGADAHVVYSGIDALEALPGYRPTVVVLDIGMSDLDGYEVSRRIRQLPDFRQIALIGLSGWGQEEDRRRSREAGFDHHLIKPLDLDALKTVLISLERPSGLRAPN